jgi:hypothetical protein
MEHPIKRTFEDDIVGKALKDIALYEQEIETIRVELAS